MATLINRAQVKAYALDTGSARARGFTRVSASFLDQVEAQVRLLIEREVRSHPSIGVTLKGDKNG